MYGCLLGHDFHINFHKNSSFDSDVNYSSVGQRIFWIVSQFVCPPLLLSIYFILFALPLLWLDYSFYSARASRASSPPPLLATLFSRPRDFFGQLSCRQEQTLTHIMALICLYLTFHCYKSRRKREYDRIFPALLYYTNIMTRGR